MQSVNYESQNQMMSKGLSNAAIERILNKKLISGSKNSSKHDLNESKKTASKIESWNSDSDNVTSDEVISKKRSKIKKRKKETSPVFSHDSYENNNHLSKQDKVLPEDEFVKKTKKIKNNIFHSNHEISPLDDDKSTIDIQYKSVKKRKRISSTESSVDEPFNIQSEIPPSMKTELSHSESSSNDEHVINSKHSSKKLKQNASSKDTHKKKKKIKEHIHKESESKSPESELEAEDSSDHIASYAPEESSTYLKKTPLIGKSSKVKHKDNMSSEKKKHKSIEDSVSQDPRNKVAEIDMDIVQKDIHNDSQNIELISSKKKALTKRIQEIYPAVKPVKPTTNLDISDSEDAYLLRIPKSVDPRLLQNVTIELDSKCKINIGERYVARPSDKIPDPSLIISDNGKVIQFKGCINMTKHIKAKKELNIEVPEKLPVPFPDNLKQRHPIFGSDFKNKIKLSEYAEKKIDEAISNLLNEEKKIKKKKHKRKHEETDKEEVIFDLLSTHSSANSKKKIKKEISEDSEISSFSNSGHERKKKKKKDKNSNITEIMQMVKSEIFTENGDV